jgi:hypothetical protein
MNKTLVSMLCAAALLGACGGGGDDDSTPTTPPVTEQVPPSVNTSVTSFMGYLVALLASAADALEPVDVSAVTPATNDTVEPDPVN